MRKALERLALGNRVIEAAKGNLVFSMRVDGSEYEAALVVTFSVPGVLRVHRERNGELLAESEVGRLGTLRAGFVPPDPRGNLL